MTATPYALEAMQERTVFVVSPPRSGSTLLMRILNATTTIHTRPEPHLWPALAHLGFWEAVDKAPYDQLQAQQAMREWVSELPEGKEPYLAACRAYVDSIYGRMMKDKSQRYFLDKTPANALVLPFMEQVYPRAKYIVLTRHPAAIFASYANSFFDGDFVAADKFNPILSRYIPVMTEFMRNSSSPKLHVRYEDVATQPEKELERISAFLDVPFEPDAVNYSKAEVEGKGLGDPIGVKKHDRPVTSSIDKWATEFAADPNKVAVVTEQLSRVAEVDLATWGNPKDSLWAPLEKVDAAAFKAAEKKWDEYSFQRRALVWARKDINKDGNLLGNLVRKTRFYCDVLLRG